MPKGRMKNALSFLSLDEFNAYLKEEGVRQDFCWAARKLRDDAIYPEKEVFKDLLHRGDCICTTGKCSRGGVVVSVDLLCTFVHRKGSRTEAEKARRNRELVDDMNDTETGGARNGGMRFLPDRRW